MPRIFLGIPLNSPARSAVHSAQEILIKHFRHSRIKWVEQNNFHITLHFIGEASNETIEELKTELARVKFPETFTLKLDRIDAFPNAKDPKTLFIATSTHPFLFVLRKRLADVLANMGLPVDSKAFTPHITIGRVHSRAETLDQNGTSVEPVTFEVRTVELIESTLTASGSIYKTLVEYPL